MKLQPLHPTDERTRIGFLPTGQAQKLGLRQGDVFVQVGDLDLGPGASAVDFLRKVSKQAWLLLTSCAQTHRVHPGK